MVILPTEKRIDWSRPPFVVIGLIVVNLLIFLLSQSHDNRTFEQAVNYYYDSALIEWETSAYTDYRLRSGDMSEEELAELQEYAEHQLIIERVFDPEFEKYLQETISLYANNSTKLQQWQLERLTLNNLVDNLSSRAYGLNTQAFSVIDLFTHQFLHADWWHLIGNMVFLFICGFAVEASLGAKRFIGFYLLGGVGGGLLFYLSHWFSVESVHLIGASGAISGVMAMYVTLFKLRKIEFFYWVLIFVGYFRAPALWLLPLYIANELVQWLATGDSNIAYSAHIGGFIAGFGLALYAERWQPQGVNQDYLEENQDRDEFLENLDRVYRAIADYRFEQALTTLEPLLTQGRDQDALLKIKLNLVRALGGEQQSTFLQECLTKRAHFDRLDETVDHWWQQLSKTEQQQVTPAAQAEIAMRLVGIDRYQQAEQVFIHLLDSGFREPVLAKLARRLAHFYERQGIIGKQNDYTELAEKLVKYGARDY